MNGMCCDIRCASTSQQLLAIAAVRSGPAGKGVVARPITIGPSSSSYSSVNIRVWSPPLSPFSRSSSSSCPRPVGVAKRVASAQRRQRGSGTKSRLSFSSSALSRELRPFRCGELEVSASEAFCCGRISSFCTSGNTAGDRGLVRGFNPSVWGVSSPVGSIWEANYYHHYYHFHCSKSPQGLLSCHGKGGRVPGGFQRRTRTVRHGGSPALSCRSGVCVCVGEREIFSGFFSKKGESALSGKRKVSGNFERMELFKPQLMDTMPFRFMSEYHTAPPRAVKDAVSPIFFFGFGQSKPVVEVVQAGDPVLHEPAVEVRPEEIGTARIEKIVNDMVATMRNAPGVGLAAPQIGVNLQIIVLEDTRELMSYCSPEECEAQQRFPFDLLVIINPKLKTKSGSGSAVFFEGCLSVEGYRALVERDLEVEVTGLGRDGRPISVEASGWKARILQHEYDHLSGTLYVDKMVPRTFRTEDNLRLPLPAGCPKQGVCKHSTKSLKL
ncbi:unnamed protein product [Calypogeia fissa]